jgi:hypothetical protein
MKMNEVTKIDAQETLPADPMVTMIERIALDPNSDLEKLERMMLMKERIDEQQSRRSFDLAMSDAKSEIQPIVKTGTVDYENSKKERTFFKHETLDGIAAVVDPILSKNGLSYRFKSAQENGNLIVTCVVAHKGGYYEETTLQGAPDSGDGKNNYQALGSAVTYLQRYTLKLALGLSAAKDDDGNGATIPKSVSPDQFIELRDKIEEADVKEDLILTAFDAVSIQEFPADRFDSAMKKLQATINKKAAS